MDWKDGQSNFTHILYHAFGIDFPEALMRTPVPGA